MTPTRGEVWLYERPNRKARPVLILLRDEAIEKLNRVLVVPSTTEGARRIPTHIWIDEADGMQEPSALIVDETFAAVKHSLTHRITVLGPEKMNEVCRALALATSCD